jgi:hypothetical protein
LPPIAAQQAKSEPLETPPQIEVRQQVATLPDPPFPFPLDVPKPDTPKTATRPPRGTTTEPASQPETLATEPMPVLVPLLSAADQEQYNREIDELLQRAEADLNQVGNRHLDERNKLDLARARSFIQQAREQRRTDLQAARNNAQRAALLADSVLRSVR